MRSFGLLLLIRLFAVLHANQEKQKSIKIDLDNIRQTASADGATEKTRFIKVDYTFRTESVVYDVLDHKVDSPSTILEGKFMFESLHHDMEGSMLTRFKLVECSSNNCGVVPPIFVTFTQGGNNIEGVFIDLNENPNFIPQWNILFAIINTIYTPAESGDGDDQVVPTVYGRCHVHFGRPEDKKFQRKINNCDLKAIQNYTRYHGLEIADYSQEVLYIQNMKIDADIVVIDAIEALSLRIPLDSKWGFQLESRTHIEITNRTVHYVNRHCTVDLSVAQCAQQNFKSTRVGHKLFENVVIGSRDVQNKLASVIEKYRVHLLDMGDSHLCEKHSSMFATIIQEAHRATEDEWRYLIRNPDNEAILPVIANVLGSMGSSSSLQVAREILFVEGPEFIDQYLFGAAHAISHDEKWHKKMMYWLADSQSHPALYWRIANTIATILMRRCESSPSNWNSCNNNKEKIVSKFITDVSNCSNNECHKNALEIFINIPITATYQYARRFVCSSSPRELQMAALYVIKATSNKLYDSQLVKSLINVFRNVCPVPTTTGESQLAVDILLRCILDQQNVATMLLRSESLHPDNHEKWQYFYKAVAASAVEDELKEELWSRMRKFKVFRPNYAQRSLIASSTSHWREIEETSNYKLNSISSMEFSSGIFKRSEFSTRMKKGKKEDEIFALTIFTEGLDSYLTESEVVQVDPYATIRLSLFGHALPTTTLFTGNSELMAAVWNSNGQTIKGFEGSVVLRDSISFLPLLSGLTVNIHSKGAVTLRLFGSCEVSLWNRDSLTLVNANISISMSSSLKLFNYGTLIQSLDSEMSTLSTFGSHTDVTFDGVPYICTSVERKETSVTLTTVEEIFRSHGTKKTTSRRIVYPGITFKMDDTTTRQCNQHRQSIERNL